MPEKQDLFTTEDWIRILKEQADSTREYRHDLYRKVDIQSRKTILDVGCGTGVITADIASLAKGGVTGIDIDSAKLEQAKAIVPDRVNLAIADVLELPFRDNTFDLVVFSAVLVHVKDQQKAMHEMARVTQKGGIVLATLEPDYAGTLSYPESQVYPLLLAHLEGIGVEISTGRKLRYLFSEAGLTPEIGLYTGDLDVLNRDSSEQLKEFLDGFWFAEELFHKIGWTETQIENYRQEQIELIKKNQFFSFMPSFYVIGRKQ